MNIIGPILLVAGIWGGAWLLMRWADRPAAKGCTVRDWNTLERMSTGCKGLEDLFLANEEFCPMCYTHTRWWKGGGSWAVERCPNHKYSDKGLLWKNMTRGQKKVTARRMDDMWKDKYGVNYFNEEDRKAYL